MGKGKGTSQEVIPSPGQLAQVIDAAKTPEEAAWLLVLAGNTPEIVSLMTGIPVISIDAYERERLGPGSEMELDARRDLWRLEFMMRTAFPKAVGLEHSDDPIKWIDAALRILNSRHKLRTSFMVAKPGPKSLDEFERGQIDRVRKMLDDRKATLVEGPTEEQ